MLESEMKRETFQRTAWNLLFLIILSLLVVPPRASCEETAKGDTTLVPYAICFNGIPYGYSCMRVCEAHDGVIAMKLSIEPNSFGSALYPIANIYDTRLDPTNWSPIEYSKKVAQKQLNYSATVIYDWGVDSCRVTYPGLTVALEKKTYHTFFSFLHYLAKIAPVKQDTLNWFLLLEGTTARARMVYECPEEIEVEDRLLSCRRFRLEFGEMKSHGKPFPKTDVLSNHILDEGRCWTIWMARDISGPPIRVKYRKSWITLVGTVRSLSSLLEKKE